MIKIFYYLRVWILMSRNAFLIWFNQRFLFLIFLVGKLMRFFLFFVFLILITQGAQNIAGYSTNQIVFFFLTFNLVDVVGQFLFREVYRFRNLLISGDFDLILVKPVNSLFRVLMGGADFIDLITIPPLIWGVYYFGQTLNPSASEIVMFVILIINGILIATAFHIVVVSLAIITLEIDHSIMIYRDLTSLGRFPVDIYREPLRGLLTYLIPVGLMVTIPARALMGMVTPPAVLLSLFFGLFCVILSVRFWDVALKKYTSASS